MSRLGRNDGVWVGEKGTRVATLPLGNAGILRCAQNDDVKQTTATATTATATATTTARAKAKYRDLSTTAAKSAAFGRDDVGYGG